MSAPLPDGWISEIDPNTGAPYFVNTRNPNPTPTWDDPRFNSSFMQQADGQRGFGSMLQGALGNNKPSSNQHQGSGSPYPPANSNYAAQSFAPNGGPSAYQPYASPPPPQQQWNQPSYQGSPYAQQQYSAPPAASSKPSGISGLTSNPMMAAAAGGVGGLLLGKLVGEKHSGHHGGSHHGGSHQGGAGGLMGQVLGGGQHGRPPTHHGGPGGFGGMFGGGGGPGFGGPGGIFGSGGHHGGPHHGGHHH